MASKPVRVPEDTYEAVTRISGLLGTTPGTLLQRAFSEYVVHHRDEFNSAFSYARKYIESQDVGGLVTLASKGRKQRAAIAAKRAVRVAARPSSSPDRRED
jgi:hypothetical protein